MNILVFSPFSAIWVHTFPEALIAESLAQHGHRIIYIGCGGVLNEYCLCMMAYGIPFDAASSQKNRICDICKKNEKIVRAQFGFSGADLSDLKTDGDIVYAEKTAASVTPENFLGLNIDGIETGRIAVYELLLKSKKSSLNFSPDEWQIFRTSLKNALIVQRRMERIFNEQRPDRVIVYNTLYSSNHIVCKMGQLKGIPFYTLHAGPNLSNRLQTLVLARGHWYNFAHEHMMGKWNEIKEKPCSQRTLKAVTDHFLTVISGKQLWTYSAAASAGSVDLKEFYGIKDEQKLICATMSSYDERFAADVAGSFSFKPPSLFPSQVDWIRALVDFVAKNRQLSLIVRVHPRDFPNRREGVLSEYAKTLLKVLTELPDNVKVNWPTENVSLYDLAKITDVFANGWSSAGKEMTLVGIPVVLYAEHVTGYPAELNYVGLTKHDYFQKLEQALHDGWDPERTRMAYRWYCLEYVYSLLNIGESYSKTEGTSRSFIARAANKIFRRLAPYREQYKDCREKVPELSASGHINEIITNTLASVLDLNLQDAFASYDEETQALKKEIRRLVHGLYGSRDLSVHRHGLAKQMVDYSNS